MPETEPPTVVPAVPALTRKQYETLRALDGREYMTIGPAIARSLLTLDLVEVALPDADRLGPGDRRHVYVRQAPLALAALRQYRRAHGIDNSTVIVVPAGGTR